VMLHCWPRLGGGGISAEHRAHCLLGLAWIWQVPQGAKVCQPSPTACLQTRLGLVWQEYLAILMLLTCRDYEAIWGNGARDSGCGPEWTHCVEGSALEHKTYVGEHSGEHGSCPAVACQGCIVLSHEQSVVRTRQKSSESKLFSCLIRNGLYSLH
jgi:hypothetical protein